MPFKLVAEVERWWVAQRDHLQQHMGENVPITQEDLKKAFMDQFFPQSVRLDKTQEFTNLTSGSMLVGQHAENLWSYLDSHCTLYLRKS